MYDGIREHIREGRLEKAFDEINKLPLNRSQRDDLLLIESGHEEYLRSQLTESADFQQRTRNRLTRDTLNLVNLIEDSQQEKKTVSPSPSPTIEKTSRTPWKAIIGGLAVLLVAATAYAFWPVESRKKTPVKPKIEHVPKPENQANNRPATANPGPANPGTADFRDDSRPTATVPSATRINPELLQNIDVTKAVLDRNVVGTLLRKKTIGVVRYGGLRTNDLNPAAARVLAPKLDDLLSNLTIKPLDAPESFYKSTTMSQLKSGTYSGGKISALDVDYLLIVQAKRVPIGKVEYNYRMINVATGDYVLKHRGKVLEKSMLEEVPKLIARNINNELE